MSNLTEYYEHTRLCPCGSGLFPTIYKNEKQEGEKACDRCKHKLLYRIFDNHFLDIFENWLPKMMFDEVAPLGYEYQWQDFLEERNCQRTEEIKNDSNYIVIKCPENEEFSIYVPKELAEQILTVGVIN